ncbi:MAG: hypothetical protein ACW986_10845 [Promethearchaeota archaeon]|jgi:hypothetical protein
MFFSIVLIIASICISSIGIIYVYLNRENYGTTANTIITILLYSFFGIIFFTIFALSTDIYFKDEVALALWKVSILFWIVSIAMLNTIQTFVIKYKTLAIIPSIFYALIGGIIISLTFLSNSVIIFPGIFNDYQFKFNNTVLFGAIITYNALIFFIMWFNFIKGYPKLRNIELKRNLGILTLQFTLTITLYTLYILTRSIIVRYFFLSFYLIGSVIALYNIITRPAFLVELTNKIYDFIIFHQSGILLYSYNFETGEETDDSLLKGSILIGINHILSNFIDKKDQLSLIKMKERDIVFEYDNIHGYAILLTTNKKNTFIEKAVSNFMKEFTELNGEKLKTMKGLINISEFRNAKKLISDHFFPYF